MSDHMIAIASDHAGIDLKDSLKERLMELSINVLDLGANGPASVDYPDFAHAMAEAIDADKVTRGVLICGTGIGISIAANRHPGVRAALCCNATMARLSRQHNDANVLVLGSRIIGLEAAKDCLDAFLTTEFEGGHHAARIEKINRMRAG